MERRLQTRVASVLILALVFGTGVAVGLAVDRTALADTPAETTGASDGDRREGDGGRDRTPMYEQVGELTDDQRARIDSVVTDFRETGRSLWRAQEEEMEPLRDRWQARFDSLVEATRSEIRAVMTEEQAERYDSLIADWERRRDERRREHDSDDGR